jgi:hypothetical protein
MALCTVLYMWQTVHPPEFDLSVIRGRDQEREGRVEGYPVDSSVVSLTTPQSTGIFHINNITTILYVNSLSRASMVICSKLKNTVLNLK